MFLYQYDGRYWTNPARPINGVNVPLTPAQIAAVPWHRLTVGVHMPARISLHREIAMTSRIGWSPADNDAFDAWLDASPRVNDQPWRLYLCRAAHPEAPLAMCMGLHGRLGAGSGLNSLVAEIIQMICKLALE